MRKEKTIYRCEGKGETERARLLWKTAEEETTKGGEEERGEGGKVTFSVSTIM